MYPTAQKTKRIAPADHGNKATPKKKYKRGIVEIEGMEPLAYIDRIGSFIIVIIFMILAFLTPPIADQIIKLVLQITQPK
jgi:hypothetical protein